MDTFETNKLVTAKSDRVLESLVQMLDNHGWRNMAVHQDSLSLSAELFDTDRVSPKDFFVIVVTCIPLGEITELLLSIATNNLERAKLHGTAIISGALRQMELKQYSGVESDALLVENMVSQVQLEGLAARDGNIYGIRK